MNKILYSTSVDMTWVPVEYLYKLLIYEDGKIKAKFFRGQRIPGTEILRHKCTWYCNVVDRSTALRSKCLRCTTALVRASPKPYWDKKRNCEAKKNSLQEQHRPWRCGVNYSSSDDVVITKYDRISFIHLIDMMWNDVTTHFFKQNILKTFVTYIANFTKLRK